MRGKKAMSMGSFLYWIVRILFLLLMFISLYFIARIYEQKELDTAEIEANIFRNYLIYSPSALSYRDVYVDRVYPGVVEASNLNSARLESAANFTIENNMFAANITLFNLSKKAVAQAYYNEPKYMNWLPLSPSSFVSRGSVLKQDKETYVVYLTNGENKSIGILKTEILVPRS